MDTNLLEDIIVYDFTYLLELLTTVVISGFIISMIVMVIGLVLLNVINIFKRI